MPIKYQITPKYVAWRLKKIACNLVPSHKMRKKLKLAMPRKWDVISFKPEDMEKYQNMLKQYPDVLQPEETLDIALKTLSFSRIGDGEFNIIIGGRNSFNRSNAKLAERLKEICESGSRADCLVCLNNYKLPKGHPTYNWFVHHGTRYLDQVLERVSFKKEKYGDAYFLIRSSRNKQGLNAAGLEKIKTLWNREKLLFVCNKKSPVVSDPLEIFSQASQREFLYIPDKDAFDSYDEIISSIRKYDTSWRIYLEAGATASVLAWDLSKEGYRMYDMGDFYKRTQAAAK